MAATLCGRALRVSSLVVCLAGCSAGAGERTATPGRASSTTSTGQKERLAQRAPGPRVQAATLRHQAGTPVAVNRDALPGFSSPRLPMAPPPEGGGSTVQETLEDGTVITGTRDEATGAFDLTYTYPDGSVLHTVGVDQENPDGSYHLEYAADFSDGRAMTAQWTVVEDCTLTDGVRTTDSLATGTQSFDGQALEFSDHYVEVVQADGSSTIDETFDDAGTPGTPDGSLHLDVDPTGHFTGTMTFLDVDGTAHTCAISGSLDSGLDPTAQCDGEEVSSCNLGDGCEECTDPERCGGGPTELPPVGQGASRAARACSTDAECDGGLCLVANEGVDGTFAPRGYCATFCNVPADCGGDAWECIPVAEEGFPGICGKTCGATSDCPFEGAACQFPPEGGDVGMCAEP